MQNNLQERVDILKKIPVELSENSIIYVEVEESDIDSGNEERKVARGRVLNFDTAMNSIKEVSEKFCAVLDKVSPNRAKVELGFEISASEGILISSLVSGKSKAGIKVTLEWEKKTTNE
jgi:hypothetical protein